MEQGLIGSWDEMEDHMEGDKTWEAYIFCRKHEEDGKKALQLFGL